MITIETDGDAIRPHLRCSVCQQPLELKAAWLAFPAPQVGVLHRIGVWGHKRCFDGESLVLFSGPRMMPWSARAVLEHLLRD
jgi:hypothetical protein